MAGAHSERVMRAEAELKAALVEDERERERRHSLDMLNEAEQLAGGLAAAPGFDVEHLFIYHAPDPVQRAQYETIRETAKHMAKVILLNTPAGSDQRAAIRKLRECVMTANASIALRGRT